MTIGIIILGLSIWAFYLLKITNINSFKEFVDSLFVNPYALYLFWDGTSFILSLPIMFCLMESTLLPIAILLVSIWLIVAILLVNPVILDVFLKMWLVAIIPVFLCQLILSFYYL